MNWLIGRPARREALLATAIEVLAGMSPDLARNLGVQGICTVEHLLAATRTPNQRESLASYLGIAVGDILELAMRAVRALGIAFLGLRPAEPATTGTKKRVGGRHATRVQGIS